MFTQAVSLSVSQSGQKTSGCPSMHTDSTLSVRQSFTLLVRQTSGSPSIHIGSIRFSHSNITTDLGQSDYACRQHPASQSPCSDDRHRAVRVCTQAAPLSASQVGRQTSGSPSMHTSSITVNQPVCWASVYARTTVARPSNQVMAERRSEQPCKLSSEITRSEVLTTSAVKTNAFQQK